MAIFGPNIGDNAIPTREAIEERFKVPCISVTGSDVALGEWFFSFPMGSHTDEPIFWSDLLARGGHTDVGVLADQSLVGETYLTSTTRHMVGGRNGVCLWSIEMSRVLCCVRSAMPIL